MREILLPRDSQPQDTARVDWSNPLAQGLVAASIADGAPDDITTYTTPNGYTRTVGPAGQEVYLTLASSQYFENTGANRVTAAPFTALAVIRPAAAVTQAVFTIYTSGTEYHELYLTSAGAAVMISAAAGAASASASGAYVAGETFVIGGRVSSATERSVWKNGLQLATNATSKAPSAAVNNRWGLWNGTTERFGGGMALRLLWNRALSDAEMAEVSRNPWQIFEPARIIVPAAASAGVSVAVPLATVALAAYSPTVSTPSSVAVPAASAAVAALAPSVSTPQAVAIPAASLTAAPLAPAVTIGAGQFVAVPIANATVSALAPSVTAAAGVSVAVPTAAIGATAYVPSVFAGSAAAIAVPKGSLSITSRAPTVQTRPADPLRFDIATGRLVKVINSAVAISF